MVASADALQFDESASVPKAEHLQKCVHAKAHDKFWHIIVSSHRTNKTENVYICIRIE